jgi:hypothetical protein
MTSPHFRPRVIVWVVTLVVLACAAPARAQSAGVRVGASVEPDQFYFGGHIETDRIVDELRFRPNVEIGVGHDLTLTALNFELAYHFPRRSGWNVYAGGGPALNLYHRNGDTDADGGFNILLGVQHTGGFFAEIKGGAVDSPNFKIGIGYVLVRW